MNNIRKQLYIIRKQQQKLTQYIMLQRAQTDLIMCNTAISSSQQTVVVEPRDYRETTKYMPVIHTKE